MIVFYRRALGSQAEGLRATLAPTLKTLLLWDIDGTLIDSGGAGERALKLALEREFGIADDLAWLEYFGRTDVWIARAILLKHLGAAASAEIERFLEAYLTALSKEMNNPHARVLLGIRTIVDKISRRKDFAQGLLTGNLRRGAEIKLRSLDLWEPFPFGAFADDAEQRDHLGPHALHRAGAHHRTEFSPTNVFVIGDTPHDVACGKAIGANTIAVATGRYTSEQLHFHNPTVVLENFIDTNAFFKALER